jgi:pantetheine-phosphate adenylyltransferase
MNTIIYPVIYKYKHAVLGGTFDRFHIGHQKLIITAFKYSAKVTIGLANEQLTQDKYFFHAIEDYKTRENYLLAFLRANNLLERAEIIKINDIYGGADLNPIYDCIFATEETLTNVKKINQKRIKNNLPDLFIELIPYVKSSDNEPVTSSRIRKGEIDRDGNAYFDLFSARKRLLLPEDLKDTLRIPLGKVIKDMRQVKKFIDNNSLLITIGDIVTINLFMKDIRSDISIFDFRTRRHKISKEYFDILTSFTVSSPTQIVTNEPGMIERRSVGSLRRALLNFLDTGEKQVIEVTGEEDLLTLPVILLSPLNTIVLYGQAGIGTVIVKVTEKKKKEVVRLLSMFT